MRTLFTCLLIIGVIININAQSSSVFPDFLGQEGHIRAESHFQNLYGTSLNKIQTSIYTFRKRNALLLKHTGLHTPSYYQSLSTLVIDQRLEQNLFINVSGSLGTNHSEERSQRFWDMGVGLRWKVPQWEILARVENLTSTNESNQLNVPKSFLLMRWSPISRYQLILMIEHRPDQGARTHLSTLWHLDDQWLWIVEFFLPTAQMGSGITYFLRKTEFSLGANYNLALGMSTYFRVNLPLFAYDKP